MGIKIQGMAPLVQVFDMPTSLGFYRKLGFEVVGDSGQGENSGWVMLRLNEAAIMLNTQYEDEYRPMAPDPARFAAHDDTCLYFGCPDVDAAYKFFCEQGIDATAPKTSHYGMKQLYVHDPDGYSLCFQWPADQEEPSHG